MKLCAPGVPELDVHADRSRIGRTGQWARLSVQLGE
jgi:hypothetical protein